MEQTYKQLSKILTLKLNQLKNYQLEMEQTPEQHLEKFLIAFASKDTLPMQPDVLNRFLNYMSEQRHCKLSPEWFSEPSKAKIISCHEPKNYTFEGKSRAYCLYGKAVSALKRKTKQVEGQRPYLCSQVENTVFQLVKSGNYLLSKNQSHEIDDILLNFANQEEKTDPIFLSNEVFSPFIPQPYALVLILPLPLPKPEHLFNCLKGTLLHVFIEQIHLLNKIMFREVFYKNSIIKGIYFIEQGQVQSTGGRIVARGWVLNGKCRAQGYGWKFKVLPFLKSIAKNQHIWKQFTNDLLLNKEYPFKISHLLGLEDDLQVYQMPDKRGRRGIKLPRIGHSSFDYAKLSQIQKVKHYDDRINDICDYKQKLFDKKSGTLKRKQDILVASQDERSQKRLMQKNYSNQKSMLRYRSNNLSSSSENILIMSVLKKLQGLTEPRASLQDQFRDKKERMRISPAKLFEKSRVMKKKRYCQ